MPRIQEEILNSQRGHHYGQQKQAEHVKGKGRAHKQQEEETVSETQETQSPTETQAASEAVEVKLSEGTDILSLATRYVDQFMTNSDKSFSAEERTSLINEIESFYSKPSREGRLEAIVFSQSETVEN